MMMTMMMMNVYSFYDDVYPPVYRYFEISLMFFWLGVAAIVRSYV